MNVFFPKIVNKHGSAMSLSVNYESVSQESCWGFQYFYLKFPKIFKTFLFKKCFIFKKCKIDESNLITMYFYSC